MEDLKLHLPEEELPRQLQCKLLQPEESDENLPMTSDQIAELFTIQPGKDKAAEDLNDEVDGASDIEADGAEQEAENLLPDHLVHPGDGGDCDEDGDLFGDVGMGETLDLEVTAAEEIPGVPALPPQVQLGDDPVLAMLGETYSDGEVMEYEKGMFEGTPLDGDMGGQVSSTASSSKGNDGTYGLNVTPADVRSRLPMVPGVKIQHHRAVSGTRSSGWQAWPGELLPSRFFSYGPNGSYSDSAAAMEAALCFCWDHNS
eukprot:Skav217735  [mRNA]  locus=scaffold906:27648:28421:+ [translate_table: standard]